MNLTKSYVQLKPKSVLMLLQFLHENISNRDHSNVIQKVSAN